MFFDHSTLGLAHKYCRFPAKCWHLHYLHPSLLGASLLESTAITMHDNVKAPYLSNRGILVILVMLQVWLEKNWKQWSVCFGCIFDMGLHWLKWEKKWASLKKISTLIFGKMFDFFVPRRSWQFPVKSDAKASISFARPWNSP